MKYNRKNTMITIVVLLVIVIFVSLLTQIPQSKKMNSIYEQPLEEAPLKKNPMQGINKKWEVDESFSTNLPIIVIDTGNEKPPINMKPEKDGVFVPIPGVTPYRSGTVKIINTGKENHITDRAEVESLIQIKRRGNSSMLYEKAQYLIKLVTESGQERYLDFFGMGSDQEWILNGSLMDKSMMRNYLALRLTDKIMPYTPESVYTEVIYHEDGRYYYEGVHLLMENVRQGNDRVAIEPAKNADSFPSYIARRDRIAEDEVILDTWATRKKLSANYLGLIYPSKKNVTQKEIDFVTEDLSKIEQVIYSNDPDIFATYSRYIDVASFVDYFLVNEFFASYDSGFHSTYMYKDKGQKLKMGPVWDFDGTMDNYRYEPLEYKVTAFQTSPWFDRLIKDKHFIKLLQKRYAELRRGAFSDENVLNTVDMITAHLGDAIDREWTRWGHIYTTENKLSLDNFGENDEFVRNAIEYRVEMYRLKTAILKHATSIGPYLNILGKDTKMDTGITYYMPLLLLVAVLGFALPAFKASRK